MQTKVCEIKIDPKNDRMNLRIKRRHGIDWKRKDGDLKTHWHIQSIRKWLRMIFPQQQKLQFFCMFWTHWAEHEWFRSAAYGAELPLERGVGRKSKWGEEREGEKEEKRRVHEHPRKGEKQQKSVIITKSREQGVFKHWWKDSMYILKIECHENELNWRKHVAGNSKKSCLRKLQWVCVCVCVRRGFCGRDAQRPRLLACRTYLHMPEWIQEDQRFEDQNDGVRTKMDEDVELGGRRRKSATLFCIDFTQTARPLSHVKTGKLSALHHGTHVSLFLLPMGIIRANRAPEGCHIFLEKSSEQCYNFVLTSSWALDH